MKVVILHQHFNTPQKGGAIRSYYLAKALVDHGMSVTVISGYGGKSLKRETYEGIHICYLPVPYDNRFGFSARSASFLKYVTGVIRRPALYSDADICYAISTPLTVGLAARWIKRRYKIPFLFEVGDLWPEAPVQLGFIKNPFLKTFLYRLERTIYEESNGVVALSTAIKKDVEAKVKQKPVYLLPNMADTEFYKPEEKNKETEKHFGVENKFVVSYIGAIGFANGLDYFLECARVAQKSQLPVHFLLCGDGALLDSHKHSAEKLELSNLTIVPFQDREGVRKIMSVTDATFVCYRNMTILETGSPNKYFDGLAAGKLIIINFSGWIREEIEAEKCGIFVDPGHPTDFVKKIEPFLADQALLMRYRHAARALAEREYSRKLLGNRLVEFIRQVSR